MNKQRRTKDYWNLIEPSYDRLDLAKSPNTVLHQFATLPEAVANLLAAHCCQTEVRNGGFLQFLSNSSGLLAPEAAKAFAVIGMPQWASLTEQAISHFGPEFPRSREDRSAALPTRPLGKKAKEWDPFYTIDSEFYSVLNRDELAWEKAANQYARKCAA